MAKKTHTQLAQSMAKYGRFKAEASLIPELLEDDKICIYVTGSYGREEPNLHSDLDLFFIYNDNGKEDSMLSRIRKTLIDAKLIEISRNVGFEDFSGDGEFLEIHNLDKMVNTLGDREDDHKNRFTARLLLLLESKPLFNEQLYRISLERVLDRYLSDFFDHKDDFKPWFLLNDILRYWRTLCINYEQKKFNETKGINDMQQKQHILSKHFIKNIKLKLSRKITCYSYVLRAISEPIQTKDFYFDLTQKTPFERLDELTIIFPSLNVKTIVARLREEYDEYWEEICKPKHELYQLAHDNDYRKALSTRAETFGKLIYDLAIEINDQKPELIRALIS